jgi:hypothetical protein
MKSNTDLSALMLGMLEGSGVDPRIKDKLLTSPQNGYSGGWYTQIAKRPSLSGNFNFVMPGLKDGNNRVGANGPGDTTRICSIDCNGAYGASLLGNPQDKVTATGTYTTTLNPDGSKTITMNTKYVWEDKSDFKCGSQIYDCVTGPQAQRSRNINPDTAGTSIQNYRMFIEWESTTTVTLLPPDFSRISPTKPRTGWPN